MDSKNPTHNPAETAHEGITAREDKRQITFDIVDEAFKKEFIECIRSRGKLRVIMDERILPNGQFGKYSQLID